MTFKPPADSIARSHPSQHGLVVYWSPNLIPILSFGPGHMRTSANDLHKVVAWPSLTKYAMHESVRAERWRVSSQRYPAF